MFSKKREFVKRAKKRVITTGKEKHNSDFTVSTMATKKEKEEATAAAKAAAAKETKAIEAQEDADIAYDEALDAKEVSRNSKFIAAKKAAEKASIKEEEAWKSARKANGIAQLKKYKVKIKDNKPAKPSGVKVIHPSDQSDWKQIKYYVRMKEDVRDNFRRDLNCAPCILQLNEAGPHGPTYGTVLGNQWHKFLSDRIKGIKIEEADEKVADEIFDTLRKFGGMELLESNFPLYGYMCSEGQVYLWQGEADVIGWYYNENRGQYEFVIIDWKVLRDLLGFWKSKEAFGMYLHQCLVYARLLQLHLELDYLPSILIVPISSDNGRDIHPSLFWDYPEECTTAIEEFSWSIDQPNPPRYIYEEWPFKELGKGVVSEEMLLKDLFADGAKVKDLLKAFDFNGLEVIKKPNLSSFKVRAADFSPE